MHAAIYARYSSENQRPESIDDQIAACRRLAAQRGFTILEEHLYADQVQSGARKDRPTLAALLAAGQHRLLIWSSSTISPGWPMSGTVRNWHVFRLVTLNSSRDHLAC